MQKAEALAKKLSQSPGRVAPVGKSPAPAEEAASKRKRQKPARLRDSDEDDEVDDDDSGAGGSVGEESVTGASMLTLLGLPAVSKILINEAFELHMKYLLFSLVRT